MKKASRSKAHAKLFIVAFVALLLQSAALVTYHSLRGQATTTGPMIQTPAISFPTALPIMMPNVQRMRGQQVTPTMGVSPFQQTQRPAAGAQPGGVKMPGARTIKNPCPLIKVMEEHFQQMLQMCQAQG